MVLSVMQGAISNGNSGGDKTPIKRPPGRPKSNVGEEAEKAKKQQAIKTALGFLKAIASAGADGIPASSLVNTMHLSSTRAIGSVAQIANRTMVAAGTRPDLAYRKERKPGQEKTWFPKQGIHAAILAVEAFANKD
jgi:hypothetical protein